MQRYYNGGLRNNTSPALTWYGTVTAVRKETGPKGKPRKVATVDVTPGRLVSVSGDLCRQLACNVVRQQSH